MDTTIRPRSPSPTFDYDDPIDSDASDHILEILKRMKQYRKDAQSEPVASFFQTKPKRVNSNTCRSSRLRSKHEP